jgi:uncharacterized protein (TIGR01244 family)
MADIHPVTDRFSTAPQLSPDDMPAAAAMGYVLIVNNRPDHEVPGQPTSAEMEAAARAAGMDYLHAPVVGGPSREQVEAVHQAIAAADGPVLAFCRSGTRSIVTWALGQAMAGERSRGDLVSLGRAAGYDLSQVLG